MKYDNANNNVANKAKFYFLLPVLKILASVCGRKVCRKFLQFLEKKFCGW